MARVRLRGDAIRLRAGAGNLSDRFGGVPVPRRSAARRRLLHHGLRADAWLAVPRPVDRGRSGRAFTPAYAYIADISAPEKRAQSFGVLGAMFGVGFIAGPALGGLLGGLGPRAPFFAAATLSVINFLYGWFVLPESLPPEKRRPFDWKRANPLGTLVQMWKRPGVVGLLGALFLWRWPIRSCRRRGASTRSCGSAGRRP